MQRSLSVKQEAICAYILAFLAAEQWPPSVREIKETFGISSTGNVDYHLNALVDKGLLERGKGARCIRLTDAGRVVAESYLARMPKKAGAA